MAKQDGPQTKLRPALVPTLDLSQHHANLGKGRIGNHESQLPNPITVTQSNTPASVRAQIAKNRVDMSIEMSPKARLMKYLYPDIPLNEFGMPEYIYRCDFLPSSIDDFTTMPIQDQGEALELAIVMMDYTDGYPMVFGSEPFWSKFPHEPVEAFRAFTRFLEMPRSPIKFADQPDKVIESPVRQLHILKAVLGLTQEEILNMSHMYYWTARANAYDTFIIASHQKMKEHRLLKAESDHYDMSSVFIERANRLLVKALDSDDEVSPKEALEILKFATGLQRLSLGVQPNSNTSDKHTPVAPGSSLEVIMRALTNRTGGGASKALSDQSQGSSLMASLMENGDDLEKAQELIIRVQENKNPRQVRQTTFEELAEQNPFG